MVPYENNYETFSGMVSRDSSGQNPPHYDQCDKCKGKVSYGSKAIGRSYEYILQDDVIFTRLGRLRFHHRSLRISVCEMMPGAIRCSNYLWELLTRSYDVVALTWNIVPPGG